MSGTSSKYVNHDVKTIRPEFQGDNRDQRGFLFWCTLWVSECLRVAKPGSPICLFTDWRQLPTTTDIMQAGGFIWRGLCVWDKTEGCRPQMGRFMAQCEYIVWGTSGASPDLPEVGCLPGVARVANRQSDKHHMTGKPTPVMQYCARICPPGGVILDPFAGSASTGVGAMREGRRFLGFEIGENYARISRERLARTEEAIVTMKDLAENDE